MNYLLNPVTFTSSISVPSTVVENYLSLAGAVQLKVLLFAIKNITPQGIDPKNIADALNISVSDAEDSLRFWADAGVFIAPNASQTVSAAAETAPKKTVVLKTVKPTRSEILKRSAECNEITFLLREAQNVFGRALKQSESSTLVWLYDDEGMSAALILTLLEYAKSVERLNIGFIERTGISWVENGVLTVADADSYLNQIAQKNYAWSVVQKAFGLDKRMPSKKELTLSDLWVNQYKISRELLNYAYNLCVDNTGKFSMSYISKIIESWQKSGVKTVLDAKASIENQKKVKTKSKAPSSSKNTYSTSNMEEFDKFINNND